MIGNIIIESEIWKDYDGLYTEAVSNNEKIEMLGKKINQIITRLDHLQIK